MSMFTSQQILDEKARLAVRRRELLKRDAELAASAHPPNTSGRYAEACAIHYRYQTKVPLPNTGCLDTPHPSDLVDYATRPYRACLDERHPSDMAMDDGNPCYEAPETQVEL